MPSWFEVTVEVPSEFDEIVATFLFDLGSPGLECSEHGGVTSLIAYFHDLSPLDQLRELCSAAGRRTGEACSPAIRSRSIDEEDWAQSWKQHFHPTEIGRRLIIAPPWESRTSGDRVLITIEPGMAFGTGQHPTTRGCLEMIDYAVATRKVSRALDVGTGSGILSIALARLGVGCVHAVDNDPSARKATIENSERNGTLESVHVAEDWRGRAEAFDLIVANLFTDLLREFANDFVRLLAPGGLLVCSGFLASDEPAVLAAYPGLELIERREEDSWVAVSLSRVGV